MSATRYLGQVGATLGIAIVGTVVSSSITGTLLRRLPTTTVEKGMLAEALQHSFVAVLIFALIALLTTFFLKDVSFVEEVEENTRERTTFAIEEHHGRSISARL